MVATSRRLHLETRPLARGWLGSAGNATRQSGLFEPSRSLACYGEGCMALRRARARSGLRQTQTTVLYGQKGGSEKSSTQRSLAVTIFLLALIDMSNGPKTPLSPATCICPATGAAAGRRHPRRPAAGGTEPGAAHRGRAASLTQTPPRRPAGSSVREGRLPRHERHAAAPAHAPCSPLSRGFPRRPPRGGPT